jgi:putative ubiquitin-RnfH superfamily antitoxin RatB of RatAB toxin-antitoxin module
MTAEISVGIVFAVPESQMLVELRLAPGATVADAIAASGLIDAFPKHALNTLPVGIWGRLTEADQVLKDGDRVEIYRQLPVDPMESRRLKASAPAPDPCESR